MKKIIFILTLAFFTTSINAQKNAFQQKQDSLFTIWKDTTKKDYDRAYAFVDYINPYMQFDLDSVLIYAESLQSFGLKNNLSYAIKHANNYKGSYWMSKGNLDKAIFFFKENIVIAEKMNDKDGLAIAEANIGVNYFYKNDFVKALNYTSRSIKYFKELGKNLRVANGFNMMGNIYGKIGNKIKSIEYYIKSYDIHKKENFRRGMVSNLINLGTRYYEIKDYNKALEYSNKALNIRGISSDKYTYSVALSHVGSIYIELKKFSKAKDYYTQALKLQEEMGLSLNISTTLISLGVLSHNEGKKKEALQYYKKGLKIKEQIKDLNGISDGLSRIGTLYKEQSKYSLSIKYCKEGYEMAKTIESFEKQQQNCDCLYESYKASGNLKKALEYYELGNQAKDSLKEGETAKKLQQMEFAKQVTADSLATAEKERLVEVAHKEEVLKKNQTRNILFGVAGLILLIAGGIYSRLRYVRKSKAIIEKEKDRSENLLLNILPAQIAEELKIKGKADARDFDMVSILFTDFKGFTEQSAKLSAAELVNEINICFEAFDTIMEKFGIEKIKTIGDAYMAAGGLPVPTDDSVKNTVLAAFEMQNFIRERKAEMDAKGLPSFQMRVGINTGPVVAGIVGVKKFQYDIWGDTVNTASRIESNGEVDKVNISQSTYEYLKDDSDFTFESRGKIVAKGKGEINMYFVSKK